MLQVEHTSLDITYQAPSSDPALLGAALEWTISSHHYLFLLVWSVSFLTPNKPPWSDKLIPKFIPDKHCVWWFFGFGGVFFMVLGGFFCLFFGLFRAALVAYGSSQARGPIGAAAASLCHSHSHSNAGSELCLQPIPQGWILNPLSEVRNRTHILMDTSRVHYCWATTRPPKVPSC